jgi:S-adenosylmethionine decarboxylase proenzyme
MNSLGKHIILELYNCNSAKLNNRLFLEDTMIEAAKLAGASIVGSHFHAFAPHGLSGMVIIKESHLAVHTWPENEYAAVDFFTCSASFDHKKAIDFIFQELNCKRHEFQVIDRGEHTKISPSVLTNQQ